MKQFLIKAAKHSGKDSFGMSEASEFIYLYCTGLADLRKTIRCITPSGYRVRRKEWFSKHLKHGSLILNNPFFGTLMYEIKQVSFAPKIEVQKEYTNRDNFTHMMKKVASDQWPI